MLLFNHIDGFVSVIDANFNTSNVTIQLFSVTNGYFFGFISIHLMLLFNTNKKLQIKNVDIFQYI